jgi:hypothetical protein
MWLSHRSEDGGGSVPYVVAEDAAGELDRIGDHVEQVAFGLSYRHGVGVSASGMPSAEAGI